MRGRRVGARHGKIGACGVILSLGLGFLLAAGCGRSDDVLVSECDSPDDCPAGERCESHRCVPPSGSTSTTGEPPGSTTTGPTCSPACPRDQRCDNGICVPELPCRENLDCPPDYICTAEDPNQHGCTFVGECVRDEHCLCGQFCSANICYGQARPCDGDPIPCQIRADCPQKAVCVRSECVWPVECLEHYHCSVGEACFNQLCWPL